LNVKIRQKLKVIGITASNTWGLFLLVLLLGYGNFFSKQNLFKKYLNNVNMAYTKRTGSSA